MKKLFKLFTLSLFVVCLFIISTFETAPCFTLMDGKLDISGFIDNWSTFRLADGYGDLHAFEAFRPVHIPPGKDYDGLEAGDYTLCRNTIQLEINYQLTEELAFFTIWRAWYEASLDFDKDLEKLIASKERDDFRKDNDLREIYVDFNPGNWRLRIGKQQIVWGESDGFRMADIINPLDFSWHYFHPPWEDIRIPLWAGDIRYSFPGGLGPFMNFFAEFVFIPNAFDGGMEPTKLAPHGSNWSFPAYTQPFLDWIDNARPDESLRNAEYGMRLRGIIKDWDVSLFSFYTWSDLPVVNFNKLLQALGGTSVNPMEYKRTMMVGGTFNVFEGRTKTVFRGECVLRIREPYNTLDLTQIKRQKSFAYMLGFDRPTWIRPLNKVHPFFISAQLFQKYVFGWSDRLQSSETSNDRHQTLLTLLINNQYTWYLLGGTDNVQPQIFGMYDFSGEGWVQPSVNFIIGDYWRASIGANFYFATDTAQAYFGAVRDNHEIYFNLRFQW